MMDWMPPADGVYDRMTGLDVYSSDEEKIGTLVEVIDPSSTDEDIVFHVRAVAVNRVGGDDWYIPENAVRAFEADRVVLETTKARMTSRQWTAPPMTTRVG